MPFPGIMNLSIMVSVLAQRMESVQIEPQFILKVDCFSCLTALGRVEKIPLGLYIWTHTEICSKNTCESELTQASWILVA